MMLAVQIVFSSTLQRGHYIQKHISGSSHYVQVPGLEILIVRMHFHLSRKTNSVIMRKGSCFACQLIVL